MKIDAIQIYKPTFTSIKKYGTFVPASEPDSFEKSGFDLFFTQVWTRTP